MAVAVCRDCLARDGTGLLCTIDKRRHPAGKKFSGHTIVEGAEAAALLQVPVLCPRHPARQCTLTCCRTLICEDCAAASHAGHRAVPLADAAREVRARLQADAARGQAAAARHEQGIARLAERATAAEAQEAVLMAAIDAHVDGIIAVANGHRQVCIDEPLRSIHAILLC